MAVVDGAGSCFHRGNHFMEAINSPVGFVPKLCLTPCMADDGCVGIRGGDVAAVDRSVFGSCAFRGNLSLCGLLGELDILRCDRSAFGLRGLSRGFGRFFFCAFLGRLGIESLFQFPIALVEVFLKRAGINNRVV